MATGIKENYVDYALFYNNTTCLSDMNISGLSVFNMNSNINTLSSYSYLNVSGLNKNLNSLSSQSFFLTNYTNLNNLNVSGTTKLNGAITCISTLNIVGNIIGSGTALTNLNYNAISNPPTIPNFNATCTLMCGTWTTLARQVLFFGAGLRRLSRGRHSAQNMVQASQEVQ